MDSQPDLARLAARLQALGKEGVISLDGDLYRFINPRFSKSEDVVSGAGAMHSPGRWNISGAFRLSYTALAPNTALAEVLAHVHYYQLPLAQALPRVLVALHLKAQRVLDLRNGMVRKMLRLSQETITKSDWRAENQRGEQAVTQSWGAAFAKAGFEAVIVPSAADHAGSNVLVFSRNLFPNSQFEVKKEVVWPA